MRPTIVKFGGGAIKNLRNLLEQVAVARKDAPIILTHGGGKVVSSWLGRLNILPEFIRGQRKTDEDTLEVVLAVLAGKVNAEIVMELKQLDVAAFGIAGYSFMRGYIEDPGLGYVATRTTHIEEITRKLLVEPLTAGLLPVVAPLVSHAEQAPDEPPLLNMNADLFAAALAVATNADRLIFVTDVEGVLDKRQRLIPHVTPTQALDLIDGGIASAGMVPKVTSCLKALEEMSDIQTCIVGDQDDGLAKAARGERVGTRIHVG